MLGLRDKSPDIWCTVEGEEVLCSDRTRYPLATRYCVLKYGRYAGTRLDQITNSHYLTWMLSKYPDNVFLQKMVRMRLAELPLGTTPRKHRV